MQGDFEKKVQAKMEELNLTPSGPVWEKIELQIQPERKRRRVFAWLLFAALLAVGGWFIATQWDNENGATVVTSTPVNASSAPSEKTAARQQQEGANKGKTPYIAPSISATNKPKLLITDKKAIATLEQRSIVTNKTSVDVNKVKQQKAVVATNGNVPMNVPEPAGMLEEKIAVKDAIQGAAPLESINPEAKQATVVVDSSTQTQAEPQKTSVQDSTGKKKKVAAVSKWRKQVFLQGGWSSYPLTASQRFYGSSANYNGPGASIGVPPLISNEKGGAFAVGFGVSKELKSRIYLSIGLQYASYTVRSKAGSFRLIDTTVSFDNSLTAVRGYYSSNQVTDYITRIHLFELPVSLGLQLSQKIPLQLSIGASYGRLLRSNALTYLSAYGNAYSNEANNLKDHINVFAGLQYRLLRKTGWNLAIGPQVQYGITRLQKEYVGKEPHLFFAGVKTAVTF